jgi:hypothetical protein
MASILKVDTIQDQSGNNIINESADTITIGASGDTITIPSGASMTVPNGGLSGQNYPAFEARCKHGIKLAIQIMFLQQNYNLNTEVLIQIVLMIHVTNYRFTPQVAGKYFVYSSLIVFRVIQQEELQYPYGIAIYKNGNVFNI